MAVIIDKVLRLTIRGQEFGDKPHLRPKRPSVASIKYAPVRQKAAVTSVNVNIRPLLHPSFLRNTFRNCNISEPLLSLQCVNGAYGEVRNPVRVARQLSVTDRYLGRSKVFLHDELVLTMQDDLLTQSSLLDFSSWIVRGDLTLGYLGTCVNFLDNGAFESAVEYGTPDSRATTWSE